MGVSLIFLRRAQPGIDLCIFGWVWVYAPTWPGISLWRYPFLDPRPEKWVGGWVGQRLKKGFWDTSANSFRFCACSAGVPFTLAGRLPKYIDYKTNRRRGSRVFVTTLTENPEVVLKVRAATIGVVEGHGFL